MPNTPTFNNLAIFGDAVVIRPLPAPPAVQVTAFGGVNGVDLLRLGSRGTVLHCTGLLWSDTYQGLALLLDTWRQFADFQATNAAFTGYTVVDTIDRIWQGCLIRAPLAQNDRMLFDRADPLQLGRYNFAFSYQLEILAPLPPILPTFS